MTRPPAAQVLDDDFRALPGNDLILAGITDLTVGDDTIEAALVLMATTKLRAAGLNVPARSLEVPAGHRLYDLLSEADRATAHDRYNGLVGRLSSFLDAVDHASAR
ncbi:hypothetical protein [Patulibacter medicamentivorans]|uniref:hypothetical protein n=1 Tax=Patulibacter medicamentivorans TaxID=1097667 RepID=UPI00058AEDDC|nr:hypothetical protein [Patulibacter medicamentivorans]